MGHHFGGLDRVVKVLKRIIHFECQNIVIMYVSQFGIVRHRFDVFDNVSMGDHHFGAWGTVLAGVMV